MKAFLAWLRAGVLMLRRDTGLILSSLGLAVISIFVFGWLFTSNGTSQLQLGIADEDGTPLTAQLLDGLQHNDALVVHQGTRADEVQALKDGHRGAVVIVPAGFSAAMAAANGAGGAAGAAAPARLQVYFDESNPAVQASARMAVQSIVAQINQQATGRAASVALDEQAVSVRDLRQIDWLTPGMLGMLLMWANLAVGAQLVQWRQQGVLKRLAATPLRPGVLIGTQTLSRLVLSLAQGALLIAVAMAVFHVQVTGSWPVLVMAVLLGTLAMISLGYVIGSFARTPEMAQTITFLISFPMMFLGGSYFPTDNAPGFLTPLIKAMPLSYLNHGLRQVINNGAGFAAVQGDLLVLAAWIVVAVVLATRAFRWN